MDGIVTLTVSGFTVRGRTDEEATGEELLEVAEEIRADIGMRLSSLGFMCDYGEVEIEFFGAKATTA